jgi:branched-chain amino acid aminotransferase
MKFVYFEGKIVPFGEAKVSVMTHALNYGTAIFEGIRAYWNAKTQQLYILKLEEHCARLKNSGKIVQIGIKQSIKELSALIAEVVRKNGYKEDLYVRPLAYKSAPKIGVRLHDIEDDLTVFAAPFGNYLDVTKGIKCCVSSWVRVDDSMIPARAKITGAYINSAFAKSEAMTRGYDEAIFLDRSGHVAEGSGENIFIIRDGKAITPPVSDNILEGITRLAVIELLTKELGVQVLERSIDRSELYIADEVFLCGTAAQVSPVVHIDHAVVGKGVPGPLTSKLSELYFEAVKGNNPKYKSWLTPVY